MSDNSVSNDKIKEIIEELRTQFEAWDEQDTGYALGRKLSLLIAIEKLEDALPPEPQEGEAWLIEIVPLHNEDDPEQIPALRSAFGSWITQGRNGYVHSDNYSITPVCKLVPEEEI